MPVQKVCFATSSSGCHPLKGQIIVWWCETQALSKYWSSRLDSGAVHCALQSAAQQARNKNAPHLQVMLLARQSRHCRQLAGEWRRGCVTWVTRLNKSGSAVEKAIQRARSVADADMLRESLEHAARSPAAARPSQAVTGNLRSVPAVQPPKEMFNAAMKATRKLKPRTDIPQEGLRAANLVRSLLPGSHWQALHASLAPCQLGFTRGV